SQAELDDHVLALTRESNLPIHFVHGVKALTRREGQAAAALADALLKGISQERIRRLFAVAHDAPALAGLPHDWTRVLPQAAPLTTVDRWKMVFAKAGPSAWPEAIDRSAVVLELLRLLAQGATVAAKAGEALLPKAALALWDRALKEGPAEALPVTLRGIRIH